MSSVEATGPSAPRRTQCRPLPRRRPRLLAADDPRRGAADVHARHLSLLACHRHAPLFVDQYRNRRRWAGIYRHAARAADRLSDRDHAAGAALWRLFRAGAGIWGRSAGCPAMLALRAARLSRAIRDLPRAALSADAHRLSRPAFPPDRLGLALCGLRRVLVGDDHPDARAWPIPGHRRGSSASRWTTPSTATCRAASKGSAWRAVPARISALVRGVRARFSAALSSPFAGSTGRARCRPRRTAATMCSGGSKEQAPASAPRW